MQFANQYSSDLPNEQSLIAELDLWNNLWFGKINVPDTAQSTLQETDAILFPNIHEMLKIVCTIPVTTCECERSVSGLRRLKTYMRTSMGQTRLNGLALLHVHYSMDINLSEVVNIFARKHERRLCMLDILNN